MPKNVRNFWIELEVDGRKTKIATGPRSKDGGFKLILKMRENGKESNKEFHLTGFTSELNNKEYIVLSGIMTGNENEVLIDTLHER